MKKTVTIYSTSREAQYALTNKATQGQWEIVESDNGWFFLAKKSRKDRGFFGGLFIK
jgi:hypothetical protein